MAKYYGIGGRRVGSVGNETYTLNKGSNVVKSKIIKPLNPKTEKQVLQRSKFDNALKSFQDLTSEFANKAFQGKNKNQSTYNAYMRLNIKAARPLHKQFTDDKNIIGIGTFCTSKGTLNPIKVVSTCEISINEKSHFFSGMNLEQNISKEDPTIAEISTILIEKYGFSEGQLINAEGIINEGVKFNNDKSAPLILDTEYRIKRLKKNFVISKSNKDKLAAKGFSVKKAVDNNYYLLLSDETNENDLSYCKFKDAEENNNFLGYVTYFVAQESSNKIFVSTSFAKNNEALTKLINLIDEDPQLVNGWSVTMMKLLILLSYGVDKVIEIINDWPI